MGIIDYSESSVGRVTVYAVMLAAVAMIVWSIVTTTQLFRLVAAPLPTVAAATPIVTKPVNSEYLLFGRAAIVGSADLPASQLDIQIVGLYSTPKQADAYAILAVRGEADKVYYVGDTITDNVKLQKVLRDAIIIEHNGEHERITLPEAPLTMAPPPTADDI